MAKKKAKRGATVEDDCQAYRGSGSEYLCEVHEHLNKDDGARAWMKTRENADFRASRLTQVHHIFGRGTKPQYGWFCSLVLIWEVSHSFGNLQRPAALDVCSLYAKRMRHERYLELSSIGVIPIEKDPAKLHWNPEAIDEISGCFNGLEGVIYKLKYKVVGSIFEAYCDHLLMALETDKAK